MSAVSDANAGMAPARVFPLGVSTAMAEKSATILIIDHELPMRRYLRSFMASENYRSLEATSGAEGLSLATVRRFDLILLDMGRPEPGGPEMIRDLASRCATPVIALTDGKKEQDAIEALDAGAVDCLTKPFGLGELAARIRAALRKFWNQAGLSEPVMTVGDLTVDLAKHQVMRAGTEIRLTPIEFKLLALLALHAGKVVTQDQLLAEIWGSKGEGCGHYLRNYVHFLRHKIEPHHSGTGLLRTIPGVGYLLAMQPERASRNTEFKVR
jgi:two-component system KDP operon response regulator KdpE